MSKAELIEGLPQRTGVQGTDKLMLQVPGEEFHRQLTVDRLASPLGYENTVTVAKSGGDFTGIKLANDFVTSELPTSTNRWLISIYPGIYNEDPIVLVPYVDIVPIGRNFTTKIIANDTSTALFTTSGIGPMSVQNFTIEGVTTNAAFLNLIATAVLDVMDCTIIDCQYGINTGLGTTVAKNITTTPSSTSINQFRVVGGTLDIHTATARSAATFTEYIYCEDATLIIGDVFITSSNVSLGLHVVGSSQVAAHTLVIREATNGVKLEDTTEFDCSWLHVDPTVSGTHLEIIDNTVVAHVPSAELNSDRLIFPDNYSSENLILSFIDTKEDNEGSRIFGKFGVGRPAKGTESAFGQGNSYTRGMLVYTEDISNVFVDVSIAARSASASSFTFTGIAADNAIYISTDLHNGDYLQFYGLKALVSTAAVVGAGEIVAEYWNGAWTEFNHMSSKSDDTYLPYAKQVFERVQSDQIRFNPLMINDWIKNDPPSEGTPRFWMRWRIKIGITTAPILEQFKVHTSRREINADGYTEYFGNGRPLGSLPWGTGDIVAWSSSPGNQDLFVLDSPTGDDYDIGIGRIENSFAPNSRSRNSIGIPLPHDIDTSAPIVLELYWTGSSASAGNIAWKTSMGILPIGGGIATVITSAPTSMIGEVITSSLEAVGVSEDGILKRSTFTFDVSDAIPIYADGSSDLFFASVVSDGGDGTDTYSGNRDIAAVRGTYLKWSDGGHL